MSSQDNISDFGLSSDDKEKRIILLRHAESEWNATGSKEPNCPLSDYGRDYSKLLSFDVDLVVCSTLRRARETLDNSKITYKDVLFTDLCRELLNENPGDYYNGEEIRPESSDDQHNRIVEFTSLLKELQESYDTICVITHYGFLERMTGFRFQNGHYMNYSLD